ncbi:SSI family serine proteinase inhibitor [Luteipulveratus sp. YIM 133132]|uniref:SSI family serine proteinase inhibitor n=1 Tax=Luteipulveratus flavus TaxID=3031728 RepID=A0ABT6CCX3_9MICO|nr:MULTISPECIES: SSI family serine proteinase inhibitor [unclassified Luteipulveratus]MDE9367382.1 SSI family serine proteinase inhibitor [Luteipulveratus sp. YIM 133132]MDF8266237.1 SSI family serine proteinase inhibitor [Luteipulveratus sp. YIM 133296]
MKKLHTVLAAAAIAAAPAVVAPTTAHADVVPTYVRLNLQVTDAAGHSTYGSLRCNPAGGFHKDPAAACSELIKVNGEPQHLFVHPEVMCTRDYRPVTARMTGYWGDRMVSYTKTFGNACNMWAATGPVFAI